MAGVSFDTHDPSLLGEMRMAATFEKVPGGTNWRWCFRTFLQVCVRKMMKALV